MESFEKVEKRLERDENICIEYREYSLGDNSAGQGRGLEPHVGRALIFSRFPYQLMLDCSLCNVLF